MTDSGKPGAELARLEQAREWNSPWRKWGPYLSERQWGTVREDYSQDGDAWHYFPHDHARSRATPPCLRAWTTSKRRGALSIRSAP